MSDWTFAGRYSTLAPSASKWSNPTTLWRAEFRNRATLQHLAPQGRSAEGCRTGLLLAGTALWHPRLQNGATLPHFGAPNFGIEQPYSTLAPRISESSNPTTLWRPGSRNRTTLQHFGAPDLGIEQPSITLGPWSRNRAPLQHVGWSGCLDTVCASEPQGPKRRTTQTRTYILTTLAQRHTRPHIHKHIHTHNTQTCTPLAINTRNAHTHTHTHTHAPHATRTTHTHTQQT